MSKYRIIYDNVCVQCGERFESYSPHAKYCNESCYRKYYNNKYRKTIQYTKICEECNKIFVTNRNKQKFCSKKCNYKFYKNNMNSQYKLRFNVFYRDNFTCQYCGDTQKNGAILQIDHIIPISRGGKNIIENLITSCQKCNLGKSNNLYDLSNIIK